MEIKLNDSEKIILQKALSILSVKSRTGEIGIIHGAERFVSSQLVLKKEEIEILEKIAIKTGLSILKKTQ